MPDELEKGLGIIDESETMEEWVGRINTKPIWREFIAAMEKTDTKEQLEEYKRVLREELSSRG